MVKILMTSAKMANLALLKIKVFLNKGYGIISSIHHVITKTLTHESICTIDVVM